MHLAQSTARVLVFSIAVAALALAQLGTARADRTPLLGSVTPPTIAQKTTITEVFHLIVPIDPDSVDCTHMATFDDVTGGPAPGTNYDGLVYSGGMWFGERFMGQTVSSNGNFDVVSGIPFDPLLPVQGSPGENLDVFDYSTNVLTGLGSLGYPDIDAIGEGAMAVALDSPQSRVKFQLVGGNDGSATLTFYRANGTLIDTITLSGLGEFTYGFATADGSSIIAGILIQNTDASGIGLDNVCHDGGFTPTRTVSWGGLKMLYH
jgi:hypothetical protein